MVARVISYSFIPGTRRITLKDVQTVDIARVQYIINLTRGVNLYDYSTPSIGTITLVEDNIIEISHSTAGMLFSDELAITYDFPIEAPGGTVTSVSGTANRIVVSSPTPNPVVDIASTYVGQTSLTTLGTITTGTWNASAIPILYGGTGQTTANAALNAFLPSQTTNSGKYLTTDGTNTSWATVTAQVYPGAGVAISTGSAWASSSTGTANQIAYWPTTTTVGSLTTATYPSLTELSYVKGVTSAVQTQVDAKLPLTGGTLSGALVISSGFGAGVLALDVKTSTSTGQATVNLTNATNQLANIFKTSASYVTYKTVKASDFGFYNGSSAGDMVFLNDYTSGKIIFGAGGSATATMTLTTAGVLQLGNTSGSANRGQIDLYRSAGSLSGTINASSGQGLNLVGTSEISLGLSANGVYHTVNGTWMGRGGITNSSATALVHIPAGTATASTAPLKFTSGTVLTTPEAGAMEFDGTNYWVTIGTTRTLLTRTITGTAAPATTPAAVGMQFVDTTNKKLYVATGTASSADWTILN